MTFSSPVVTRFAPSPTGFLHIGGARTALFSWLYARGRGGVFRLRIEDTDRARSTPEATAAIIEGLTWLGLDWDGEIVSQFARADRHRAAALSMIESGAAFRCYVPMAELEARRTRAAELLDQARTAEQAGGDASALRAEAAPLLARFVSPYRDGGAPPSADAPFVVRLKTPLDGETVVEDGVQGRVVFPNKDLDDLILLRSDGTPTYNLAVVVDDHDMDVTHVIRGDDHLVNAGRQTQIYQALGWTTPQFAHVPLIHGSDGKKLSKRHGALGVDAYRDLGCVPAGLRNYLLRLGWSHGDKELFTDEEARAAFDIAGINKAPARLDLDKLAHVNAFHMRAMPNEALEAAFLDYLERMRPDAFAAALDRRARLSEALPFLKERAQTLADLADLARFLLQSAPIALEPKARQALNPDAVGRLTRLTDRLETLADWSPAALKAALEAAAQAEGVGFGMIGGPLRAAVTGGSPAPDLTIVLSLLGREETLARLRDACGPPAASSG